MQEDRIDALLSAFTNNEIQYAHLSTAYNLLCSEYRTDDAVILDLKETLVRCMDNSQRIKEELRKGLAEPSSRNGQEGPQ